MNAEKLAKLLLESKPPNTASLPKRVTNNIFRALNFVNKKKIIIKSGNYCAKCPFKGYTVPKFDTQKVRRKNRKIKLNNTIPPWLSKHLISSKLLENTNKSLQHWQPEKRAIARDRKSISLKLYAGLFIAIVGSQHSPLSHIVKTSTGGKWQWQPTKKKYVCVSINPGVLWTVPNCFQRFYAIWSQWTFGFSVWFFSLVVVAVAVSIAKVVAMKLQ